MTPVATSDITAVQELAERYGEAWNSQDLDAIVTMHADDGTFELHVPGGEVVSGREGIRAAFAGFLAQLPDIHFEPVRLRVGADFWSLESTMSGTVAAPIEVEGEEVEADGARVAVDAVDIISVRDGLVQSKDTYLDALAFERQLGLRS
jgi:steroid delta-isomerase-like uncharacterized protein